MGAPTSSKDYTRLLVEYYKYLWLIGIPANL